MDPDKRVVQCRVRAVRHPVKQLLDSGTAKVTVQRTTRGKVLQDMTIRTRCPRERKGQDQRVSKEERELDPRAPVHMDLVPVVLVPVVLAPGDRKVLAVPEDRQAVGDTKMVQGQH